MPELVNFEKKSDKKALFGNPEFSRKNAFSSYLLFFAPTPSGSSIKIASIRYVNFSGRLTFPFAIRAAINHFLHKHLPPVAVTGFLAF